MERIDVTAAERFMLENARLLDRHRLAVLRDGAATGQALAALAAYRNDDGGFGHALEPDVRAPHSEPVAALHALDVLDELGELAHPWVAAVADWTAGVALADASVPFILEAGQRYPRGPWMQPTDGGSHLTLAIAARLAEARLETAWSARAQAWCWQLLEDGPPLEAYWLRFALDFLDAAADHARADAALERLRPQIGDDGTVAVPGGTDGERLTPLALSVRPAGRSRRLFSADQIGDDLDRLAAAQQPDGGWTFDWLAWSPGQSTEWRGILTLRALRVLGAHGRLAT